MTDTNAPNGEVWDAINTLSKDPGAIYAESILNQLRSARDNDPANFSRYRQAVKESKVIPMPEFEKITKPQESGSKDDLFPEIEFWPDPVDGSYLLDEIVTHMKRFIVADQATLDAATLWAAYTWFLEVLDVAPIANITAPEKRCGKTVLLSFLGKICYRPLTASNIGAAALFRTIEKYQPTLLIDEVDSFLSQNEEARGILNAGFTRDSAFVIRCVGDDHEPTPFNVFGPKVLCGIGKIAATLEDRSIPLRLRRKRLDERTGKMRREGNAFFSTIVSKLARFAGDNQYNATTCHPAEIDGLNDRANDCWEPLLIVAELAGGEWPAKARRAAIALHGVEEEAPSISEQLLHDIKLILDQSKTDRISTADLIEKLVEDDESPWATWNKGKPISPRQLSTKLSGFKIRSNTIRFSYGLKKGYLREDFDDAFNRYIPTITPFLSVTPLHASNDAGSSDFIRVTESDPLRYQNPLKPSNGAGCNGVTDKSPLLNDDPDGEVLF